jgi:hypothetical protein
MLTRRVDAALDALCACRERVPFLRDQYRPETPQRAALDDVLAALHRADEVMLGRDASPPAGLS